jgi:hypothetical protein
VVMNLLVLEILGNPWVTVLLLTSQDGFGTVESVIILTFSVVCTNTLTFRIDMLQQDWLNTCCYHYFEFFLLPVEATSLSPLLV